MVEPASSVKSAPRRENAARQSPGPNPPATSALHAGVSAGNLALQRLAAPLLQRKIRFSARSDAYEEEADHVSQHILSLISAPTLQRKCACGGEGECDECNQKAAERRAAIRSKTDDLAIQRDPAGEEAPGTTATAGTADNSSASSPVVAPSNPGLIVEDNITDLGAGQMKKDEFLGQLHGPVTTAAQAGLQGTKWSSLGMVAIEPWFLYYSRQSAQQLERTIQQSVPGSAGITSASAYIPLVSLRVQGAVGEWARTGKVPTGVPAGLPGIGLPGAGVLSSLSSLAQNAGNALSNVGSAIGGAVSDVAQGAKDVASSIGSGISSAAQGVGNALSNIAGVLFKAKAGSARHADDPRAIQSQLGGGESLDGSLQSRMSSAFGYDFSSVRVHKDNRAAQLSSDLNARAFTIGNTVAFGAKEYQPGTLLGDALIAHELAHVVQQGGATAQVPLQKGESETGCLEDDADFSAVRAVATLWSGGKSGLANVCRSAVPALKSGLKLQRCGQKVKRCPHGYSWRVQSTTGMGSFGSLCHWKCLPGEAPRSAPQDTISCPADMNCDTGVRYEDLDSSYTKTGYGASFTPLGEQAYTGCFPLDEEGRQISDVPLRPTDFEMTDVAGPLADAAAAAKGRVKPRLDPTTGTFLPDEQSSSGEHDQRPKTTITGDLGVDVAVGTARANDYRSEFNAGKGRNVAFADYDVAGQKGTLVGISGSAEREGTVPTPGNPQLPTLVVGHDRAFDSEKKILEHMTTILGDNPNASGTINLFSERNVCAGCDLAIAAFRAKYPKINLNVVSGRK